MLVDGILPTMSIPTPSPVTARVRNDRVVNGLLFKLWANRHTHTHTHLWDISFILLISYMTILMNYTWKLCHEHFHNQLVMSGCLSKKQKCSQRPVYILYIWHGLKTKQWLLSCSKCCFTRWTFSLRSEYLSNRSQQIPFPSLWQYIETEKIILKNYKLKKNGFKDIFV